MQSNETLPADETSPAVSIVVPTYDELENIKVLSEEILAIFAKKSIAGELIVVDDASPDGTGRFVDELSKREPAVRALHRSGKLGLTSAVTDGFATARGEILGVMDADLSHPVSALPGMLTLMDGDTDFVIGSRYIAGGAIDGWPLHRRVISRTACMLARPFTPVRDPMSGYFLIRRRCLEGVEISARGFKICLDLLVKADYRNVREFPIRFVDRRVGQSKLSSREVLNLLTSLARYVVTPRRKRRRS